MPESTLLRRNRPWLVGLLAVVALGSLLGWQRVRTQQIQLAKNFQPMYVIPTGWHNDPHGPSTLFKLTDPMTHVVLRAAVNQVISDSNPTPDLDTEGIANFYMDRTEESMPTWKAVKLKKYANSKGTEFEILRRSTKDRVVVTAYSVRGNTTFLVTLFGKDRSKDSVDPGMGKLYSFLDTVSLDERDMSKL
jgi:hypothetical protein